MNFAPTAAPDPNPIEWADPARGAALAHWLEALQPVHGLRPDTLRAASADASFRRYLRLDCDDGTRLIVMDAPPELEASAPFVQVSGLMADAGLQVPRVHAWDEGRGFLLLDDLGTQTLMEVLDPQGDSANQAWFVRALEPLVAWQRASRPGVLPEFDAARARAEMQLFEDWYLRRHLQVEINDTQAQTLHQQLDLIAAFCADQPRVYVHADYMPRNLMVPPTTDARGPLGVLDFQDAFHGPLAYDLASLVRDAFVSWEEDFVLDVAIRYWQQARAADLPVADDFGEFYRAMEWVGLQRHLRIVGTFARLTLRDGKPRYLADAPRFIGYIRATAGRYRELRPLLRLIDAWENTPVAVGYAYGRV